MAPASIQAIYEYGARGSLPPVKLTWYQGLEKPQIWKEHGIPQRANGHLFIGDKGMLLSDYSRHVLLPEETFAASKNRIRLFHARQTAITRTRSMPAKAAHRP